MSKRKPLGPLEYKWDGKIRSPRELFRLLHDFLNKYNYEHIYHELKDESGAIDGTATFSDSLTGKQDLKIRNKWLLIDGIILIVAGLVVLAKGVALAKGVPSVESLSLPFTLFLIGWALIDYSSKKLRKCISLHVEGETYRARAEQKGETSSEVYDVVSNCRVIFSAKVGRPATKAGRQQATDYGVAKLSRKVDDWAPLRSEFESLTADFQKLRPKIEIPEAIMPNKTD